MNHFTPNFYKSIFLMYDLVHLTVDQVTLNLMKTNINPNQVIFTNRGQKLYDNIAMYDITVIK